MKILFIASEVAPYSKTGGLGDVAGALPAALAQRGHEVMVVSPRYAKVSLQGFTQAAQSLSLAFPFGAVEAALFTKSPKPKLTHVMLEVPSFFHRANLYGEADDHRRFAALGVGALAAAQVLGFRADIVHLNDWQTGLVPVALKGAYSVSSLGAAKSVMTVHNLAFQGNFAASAVPELGLPWELFTVDGFEFYGQLSFMKAGLQLADAITTVSPTYAREIQTHELGAGFDGLLRNRSQVLHGILNGIDTEEWNPLADKHLPAAYSAVDLKGKEACAKAVLQKFSLLLPEPGERRAMLLGSVGRFTEQKGVGLAIEAMPALLERGAQVVVLGSGDDAYVRGWQALKARYPGRVGLYVGFDESLAHLIEAGADFFVMPSRFEPCGLNQMYSLRYGTVPIVRATGGLQDSVVPYPKPDSTGFHFGPYDAKALEAALLEAYAVWQKPAELEALRRRGMAQDFSWDNSARRYEALYTSLLAG